MTYKENFEPNVDFQLPKTHLESYDLDIIWGVAKNISVSNTTDNSTVEIDFSSLTGDIPIMEGLSDEGFADLMTELYGIPTTGTNGKTLIWNKHNCVINNRISAEDLSKIADVPLIIAQEALTSHINNDLEILIGICHKITTNGVSGGLEDPVMRTAAQKIYGSDCEAAVRYLRRQGD